MKAIFITVVLFFLSISVCLSQINNLHVMAQPSILEKYEGVEYTVSGGQLKIGWSKSTGAIGYEIRLKQIDLDLPYEIIDIPDPDTLTYTFTQPRAGHFIIEIRAYNLDVDGNKQYSSWVNSTDDTYSTVDGVPKSWRVYWKLAPPGDPIIE